MPQRPQKQAHESHKEALLRAFVSSPGGRWEKPRCRQRAKRLVKKHVLIYTSQKQRCRRTKSDPKHREKQVPGPRPTPAPCPSTLGRFNVSFFGFLAFQNNVRSSPPKFPEPWFLPLPSEDKNRAAVALNRLTGGAGLATQQAVVDSNCY